MRNSVPSLKLALVLIAVGCARLGVEFAAPAQLSVVQEPYRILPAGPGAATISRLDGERTGYYYDLGELAGQLRPHARQVVMLGLGGGEMLRAARRALPHAELVGVERDPLVIRAARDEFRIGDFGARAVHADAFTYVRQLRDVDVLLVDLFDEDRMPAPLFTWFFFSNCRSAISKRGLVAVNVYPAAQVSRVSKLLEEANFAVIITREVKGSTVVFAEPKGMPTDL